MTTCEPEAIKFLQQLINFEKGTLEDGRPDPGWCCSEHSMVASLAYCICGFKVRRCRGKVIIGSIPSKQYYDVHPHDFVLMEDPIGITDTSVSFESIRGIPIGFGKSYSELGVGIFNGKPTGADWIREAGERGKPIYALYAIKHSLIPNEDTLKYESSTPFGKWLTSLLGSQKGLWPKAAWCAAEIYAGRIPFEYEGLGKSAMWKIINATTDRNNLVLDRLESINAGRK
jgi:hypothetical protein